MLLQHTETPLLVELNKEQLNAHVFHLSTIGPQRNGY
jgi:hypothetical protein